MLFPMNDYLLYLIKTEKLQQFYREAEIDHLPDERNSQQPSWLECQIRKGLHRLGHSFLAIGQRLDRVETHTA